MAYWLPWFYTNSQFASAVCRLVNIHCKINNGNLNISVFIILRKTKRGFFVLSIGLYCVIRWDEMVTIILHKITICIWNCIMWCVTDCGWMRKTLCVLCAYTFNIQWELRCYGFHNLSLGFFVVFDLSKQGVAQNV